MKQLSEDYVSFETAKLLKEKGFDIPCDYAYNNKAGYFEVDRSNFDEVYCFRPSLAMAMKWLREVHKIHIGVGIGVDVDNPNHIFYAPTITTFVPHESVTYLDDVFEEEEYETYEQACEAAIKYCLEHLI